MARDLKRILYVEDEVDIQTIAVTVLEAVGGFAVVACTSGQQAIDAAPGANADLILLDVMMPGMDGPTTLQALREIPQTAATPVIFMTAKVQASEIEHFRSLGALDVIPKPFDPMTLSEQISTIWRRCADAQKAAPPAQPAATESIDAKLEALFKGYADDLPANIAKIEALWVRFVCGTDPPSLKALHRALHSLAGSGVTFGYTRMGNIAKAMELDLAPCLERVALQPAMIEAISSMFEELKQAAHAPDPPACCAERRFVDGPRSDDGEGKA